MPERVFHLVDPACWPRDGSPHAPDSLQTEGFLHASFPLQLAETLALHFDAEGEGAPAALLLLELDRPALAQDLRVEASRGGAGFPHLYRALEESEVLRWWTLEARLGRWLLPVLELVADEDQPQGTLGAP